MNLSDTASQIKSAIGALQALLSGEPEEKPEAERPEAERPEAVESATDHDLVGDLVPLVEKAVRKDGTVPIKVIAPGWGSSGFYKPETLQRDGPKVFTKGLQMFVDHPTATEEAERPERSVNGLGAVLESDARWDPNGPTGPGLYADAKPFSPFKERLDELAPHIGVSIRAVGKAVDGEVEGRKGKIIEAITAARSVDFVTVPGAGWQVLQLFEAARNGGRPLAGGQATTRTEVDTVNEQEAQALRESVAAKETENARLKEKLLLFEARVFAGAELAKADIPEPTRARLLESLSRAPVLDGEAIDEAAYRTAIDEAVKTEVAYLATITGSGQIRGMSSASTGAATADRAALKESWKRLGLTDEQAELAITGR